MMILIKIGIAILIAVVVTGILYFLNEGISEEL